MRLGITGPSGSGKTTLSHVLAGVESLTLHGIQNGSITVDGAERTSATATDDNAYRHPLRIGMVLQNPESQLFAETVLEEVQFGGQQCSEADAADALRRVGLEALASRSIRSLSLGQKQRVVIASFLAADPQLLILDEPTNYLDAVAAEKLFTFLKTLPVTQVVVEHDIERLCGYADHIIELDGGEIVAQGSPGEWLQRTRSRSRFRRTAIIMQDNNREPSGLSVSADQIKIPPGVRSALRKGLPGPGARPGNPVVECIRLYAGYQKGDPVLKDVSLAASTGERVALLGLNGSGKTTLLKCLAGLVDRQQGTVLVEGAPPRPGVAGFVYQNPDYQIFEQTTEAECGFALRLRHCPDSDIRDRVNFWLKETGLLHVQNRLPLSLSYGEKRRLTLASILVAQPSVLLLDEPTTALDDSRIGLLSELLVRVSTEQHLAILFATHDIDFALDTATRIVFLAEGRVVQDCRREQVSFDDLSRLGAPLPRLCAILQQSAPACLPLGIKQLETILRNRHDNA